VYILSLLQKDTKNVKSITFLNFKVSGYSYSNLAYLLSEIFITNEYFFKPTSTEPVIIDCGANIGMSNLYFKSLFPNSKIISFEANPNAYKLLEKNIRENNLDNIEIHNVALFDKETEISFYISEDIGTLLGSTKSERGGGYELKVKSKKLSSYLKNLPAVDLIKMDVEGAEIEIISDLFESSLMNKVKEFIIEYHHNVEGSASAFSSFLQKFEIVGFDYNIRCDFKEVGEFQDVLFIFIRDKLFRHDCDTNNNYNCA